MTDKSLFGALIRAIGVVLLLIVLDNLYSIAAAWIVWENVSHAPSAEFDFSGTLFWSVVWKGALGVYLLRGAPSLIELAYADLRGKRAAAKKFIT